MKPFHLSLILTVVFTSSLSAFQVDSFNLKVGSSYHITSSQSLERSQIIMGAPNTTNIENETLELLEVLENAISHVLTLRCRLLLEIQP